MASEPTQEQVEKLAEELRPVFWSVGVDSLQAVARHVLQRENAALSQQAQTIAELRRMVEISRLHGTVGLHYRDYESSSSVWNEYSALYAMHFPPERPEAKFSVGQRVVPNSARGAYEIGVAEWDIGGFYKYQFVDGIDWHRESDLRSLTEREYRGGGK